MAEEDIIFGKKRHFFGGIEPSNMLIFNATPLRDVEKDTIGVRLTCKLPKNTVIDNQMICTVGGAVIRRSSEHYPINEFDGVLIADIKEDTVLIDNDIESDITYYYAAFPYSGLDVYNRNILNRTEVTPTTKRSYYFGYDIDLSDPDPATRVTYPSDVDNADYEPAGMIWDTTKKGTFSYGDWPKSGEKFMPKPCIVDVDTGEVYAYINPDNIKLLEDGRPSYIDNSSPPYCTLSAYMMEFPKIYTKREEIDGVYKFRCSDVPEDETWDCWCNYDDYGNIIDNFYVSMFYSKDSTTGQASGSKPYSDYSTERATTYITTIRDACKNTVPGFSVFRLVDHLLIQDLLVMMGKSTDSQDKYGWGDYSSTSNSSPSIYALFQGNPINTEWDFYNVVTMGLAGYEVSKELIEGWVLVNDDTGLSGVQKIKITNNMYDGSTAIGFEDYNGYIVLDDVRYTSYVENFISGMKTTPWGRIPCIAEGSGTTYEADFMYLRGDFGSSYKNRICHATRHADDNDERPYGQGNGLFSVGFNHGSVIPPSTSSTHYKNYIRLSYKPSKQRL